MVTYFIIVFVNYIGFWLKMNEGQVVALARTHLVDIMTSIQLGTYKVQDYRLASFLVGRAYLGVGLKTFGANIVTH